MEAMTNQLINRAMSRRTFVNSTAALIATPAVLAALASLEAMPLHAQDCERDVTVDNSGTDPVRYPENGVISLDPRFDSYKIGNTPILCLHTGMLWAEGPVWNGVGNYLIWSDIPNNIQHRWLHEDGHVSIFRNPSGNSNGNTFDLEGRQISCEHLNRRVVRYEHDGSITVLADSYNDRPLNSPNDVVVHPDGGIWFTDPPYGSWSDYEGTKGDILLKEAVYRIDPISARIVVVTDEVDHPNGLCFSPDFRKLYVVDTGAALDIKVWDVIGGTTLANPQQFADSTMGDVVIGLDGVRADVDGNIWAAVGWTGAGYDGVHIFAPDGERIGQILLPETCANLCFGGPKRNRLFMAASQSLYAVYVNTQGAGIS